MTPSAGFSTNRSPRDIPRVQLYTQIMLTYVYYTSSLARSRTYAYYDYYMASSRAYAPPPVWYRRPNTRTGMAATTCVPMRPHLRRPMRPFTGALADLKQQRALVAAEASPA